jgi:FeS assembly SUF system protein
MTPKAVPLGTSRLQPGDAEPEPASMRPAPSGPVTPEAVKDRVVEALRTVYDPEIPVNIFELGLVYDLEVNPACAVNIRMTLTSPACPVAGSLPGEVQSKVRSIPGVTEAKVDLVWDPPWDKERMSEAAKLQLGFF